MPNRNQLNLLTDEQAAEITALGNALAVAEIVKIYWPDPDGTKAYAFWNLNSDPLYSASALSTFLDGAPLITAFIAEDADKLERFHEIPRTSAIGDDVVRMKFANRGRVFEELASTYRGGVKVEIFYYFPQVDGGLALNWFQGHLRAPDSVNADYVEITVAAGLRSPDLLVPNRVHAGQCTFAARFGGRFDPLLPNNPCDYDRHTGGSRGNLDEFSAYFFTCPGTKEACMERLGDLDSYGGFDAISDTSAIGSGSRTTVSETQGQTTRLKTPIQVAYGEGTANSLPLLDFAKEYNPSSKHQDKGTIRTLFEISEGPIEEVTLVEVMDRPLPRTNTGHGLIGNLVAQLAAEGGFGLDGLGLETRLGTQGQAPTTYSASVLNYNRLAHLRGDVNPINPLGVTASQIVAKCHYKGRNTVRVYSDADTYAEDYTQLRAWVALDLLIDTVYGNRDAVVQHSIADFLHLASLGSTFNGLVQGKSAHQQFQDICLAGLWFLPFNHNGLTRWLAIEEYDFEETDIPHFTDTASSRNILVDGNGVSRLTVTQKDDDKIPNVLTLTFTDAEHKDLERPILFPDADQMERAGEVYGDGSLREVPDQETAFGTNNLEEARAVGWYVLDFGRFYSGGTQNNAEVTMYCPFFTRPEVLNLHENKVIRLTSAKLANAKDRSGVAFQWFIVKKIVITPRGEAVVTLQAYKNQRTDTSGAMEGDTGTGGEPVIQEVADSAFVLIDRIWRAQEMAAGIPGIYVAAASTDPATFWAGFDLHRDLGSGYNEIYETDKQAVVGVALTALAGTETGTETVDVQIQPGQSLTTLPSGAVYFYLGGEIFKATTRTQLDTDPNQWRLSNLTERGAKCTTAFKATHVIGDKFALLDPAKVLFLPLETEEIGMTRNYKGFTSGQDIDDFTAQSFTFAAPNFVPATPADYALTLDAPRGEVLHTWTPVVTTCLVATGLAYEIYDDAAGVPDTLLWTGSANSWREVITFSGSVTRHFRVVTMFGSGAFEARVLHDDGGSEGLSNSLWILPSQIFDENAPRAVTGYDRLGVEIFE